MLPSTLFASVALLLQQGTAESGAVTTPQIVMDAQFEDWAAIKPTIVDRADAPEAFVDFGEVRISHDDRFVHLLIDFGKTVNAQGLDGHGYILLDVDGDAKTGRAEHGLDGVDIIVDLSPPQDKRPGVPGWGIGLRSTTYTPPAPDPNQSKIPTLNPYDIGLMHAPTYAARRIEFRMDRGVKFPDTAPLFTGNRFSGKLVFIDLSDVVADQTDMFTHELSERAKPQSGSVAATDPLRRDERADLRVVSWNARLGAIISQPQPFARVLNALKPDVILLQEMADENTVEQLRHVLDGALPLQNGEHWQVLMGAGGGDLRCAIASRLPLAECTELGIVALPHRPEHSLRAAGAWIEHQGKRMLATSIHLKCCGRAGGPEDQQRQIEVQLIQEAIREAASNSKMDGLIIAGDFNLVGSRDPLEVLAAGLDRDGSSLGIADPYQLDGLSNATWSDPAQPFVPGRLDYIVFSDSALNGARSFVFDSRDLSEQELGRYRVLADDTVTASDHMPVVVDFRWIATGR